MYFFLQEKVLNHAEIERYTEEKLNQEEKNKHGDALDKNIVKQSACCVIS